MTADDRPDRTAETTDPDDAGQNRPAHEPGPAVLRDDAPAPGPHAPDDPAPDLAEINPGEGPGVTPGE